MKKILIIAAGAMLFATACKKERVCECTSTSSGTNTDSQGRVTTYVNEPQTDKTTYKKVRKSDLRTICGNSKYVVSSAHQGNGTSYSSTSTSEVKCEIK